MSNDLNMINQKFNKLTVIQRAEDYVNPKTQKRTAQYLCQCDCGNQCIVVGSKLKNNTTKSCGCLRRKTTKQIGQSNKGYNSYNLTGEYGIGYTAKGEEFYFDLEDYDLIKQFCWYIKSDGYVASNYKNKELLQHRLITNCPLDKIVDHINHCTFDNRKINLRICTQEENNMNRDISKNNTSGTTGVYWNKRTGKWIASLKVGKQCKFLGYFENKHDAITARKNAEEQYFKEYSFDNSTTNKYQQ